MGWRWLALMMTCGWMLSMPLRAETAVGPVAIAAEVEVQSVPTESAIKPEQETYRLKEEVQRGEGTSMGEASLQMLLGLGAVLAVIFGLSWLARRLNVGVPGATANMKVVSALSVGQKEKVLLVEVDNQRLLLGVTPQQITVLKEMGEAPARAEESDFAHRMQSLLKAGSINEK